MELFYEKSWNLENLLGNLKVWSKKWPKPVLFHLEISFKKHFSGEENNENQKHSWSCLV